MRKCAIIYPVTRPHNVEFLNAYREAELAFPDAVVLDVISGQNTRYMLKANIEMMFIADCVYVAQHYDRCPVGRALYALAKELDLDIVNPNLLPT